MFGTLVLGYVVICVLTIMYMGYGLNLYVAGKEKIKESWAYRYTVYRKVTCYKDYPDLKYSMNIQSKSPEGKALTKEGRKERNKGIKELREGAISIVSASIILIIFSIVYYLGWI